ncbi:MAG: nitroreductase [Clostridiales bacterium]|nr:nitroreductase [Clostridiales bacterium]
MSFLDIAKRRYSVRAYEDIEVEKEKLLQILEAGRLAPSAVNYQPVHFIVITDKEQKKKVYETYPRGWLEEAPVIIVACGDHSVSWKRRDGKDHCDIDLAIAVDHMTLAAADLGLGTCWICAFDAEKCRKLLELPDNLEPMVLLPVGYPKGGRLSEIKRKSLDEIVSWEEYKGGK